MSHMASPLEPQKPSHCVIVSPALANANNGNWHTARRWQHYATKIAQTHVVLSQDFVQDTAIANAFPSATESSSRVAIALHALRSARAIERLHHARVPVAVVLTGTDIYRDIRQDDAAKRSLELADLLVVLNEQGLEELPSQFRHKARCIFQSAPARRPLTPRKNTVDFAFVGHLRGEKDPLTSIRALSACPQNEFRLRMVGDAHPSAGGLIDDVKRLASKEARVELLGALPHTQARNVIARSHALVLSSVMEGGANVLIEAVTSQKPVLASRVAGNLGLLGAQYPGYFTLGDHEGLAKLMQRSVGDTQFYRQLIAACAKRAPLFAPSQESEGVCDLVKALLVHAGRRQAE